MKTSSGQKSTYRSTSAEYYTRYEPPDPVLPTEGDDVLYDWVLSGHEVIETNEAFVLVWYWRRGLRIASLEGRCA